MSKEKQRLKRLEKDDLLFEKKMLALFDFYIWVTEAPDSSAWSSLNCPFDQCSVSLWDFDETDSSDLTGLDNIGCYELCRQYFDYYERGVGCPCRYFGKQEALDRLKKLLMDGGYINAR